MDGGPCTWYRNNGLWNVSTSIITLICFVTKKKKGLQLRHMPKDRLAIIFWLVFQLCRQLIILARQVDFCGLISPLKIKISKIRATIFFILDLNSMLTTIYRFWVMYVLEMSIFPCFKLPTSFWVNCLLVCK